MDAVQGGAGLKSGHVVLAHVTQFTVGGDDGAFAASSDVAEVAAHTFLQLRINRNARRR
jgi:hypothetical protein